MELILKRIAKRKTYTIGRLAIQDRIDDEYLAGSKLTYLCDTLEPTRRELGRGKGRLVKGHTAIPEGRYAVVIAWSAKRKEWLPILLGVPMFSDVRLQTGNTVQDTEGSILVGQNLKQGMVLNSNTWLHRLKQKIVEAKGRGEAVWITIV